MTETIGPLKLAGPVLPPRRAGLYHYDAEPQIVHRDPCAVVAYEKALAAWDRRNEEK